MLAAKAAASQTSSVLVVVGLHQQQCNRHWLGCRSSVYGRSCKWYPHFATKDKVAGAIPWAPVAEATNVMVPVAPGADDVTMQRAKPWKVRRRMSVLRTWSAGFPLAVPKITAGDPGSRVKETFTSASGTTIPLASSSLTPTRAAS